MLRFLLSRFALAIPTLLIMLTMIFILIRIVPGDPAAVILGDQASAQSLAALRTKLGIDAPLWSQYLSFLGNVLSGNFGTSLSSGRTVLQEVSAVLPYTLELTIAGLAVGTILGVPLGIVAAIFRNSWADYASRLVSLTGVSLPSFVTAVLLLLVFAVQLKWLPVMSMAGGGSWSEHLRQLALPTTTMALIMLAYIARVTRSAMLDVLGQDYIRTARAKGVRPLQLILRHALRNALIPIITVFGLYFGTMIGNSVLVEIVFSRPGLGKLILGALNARDYTLLQGLMIVFAACVIAVNTLTDIVNGIADPRARYN